LHNFAIGLESVENRSEVFASLGVEKQ